MTLSNDLCFLEPRHSHHLEDFLAIASLLLSLTTNEVPKILRDVLSCFLESTSIAFASLLRLLGLVQQRSDPRIVTVGKVEGEVPHNGNTCEFRDHRPLSARLDAFGIRFGKGCDTYYSLFVHDFPDHSGLD